MKLPAKFAIASLAILTAASSASAQNATTEPVGFVTVNITAGTGNSKKLSFISAPLLDIDPAISGQTSGLISAVGTNTISNSSAGWVAGQLSSPASPSLIQITSGTALGKMFLISTTVNNTSDTVTINADDITQIGSLSVAGVQSGDTYRLYSCDTISSLFGTPDSTGIVAGGNSSAADTVTLVVNGSSSTYFYSSTSNRWSRVAFGNPDATNTPVRPYYGIQFERIGATPISLTTTGSVPVVSREVLVKNSGLTYLSQFWPVDSTLASLGIQSLPSWTSGSSQSSSDTLVLVSNGASTTYFYDGTNWRRVAFGNPLADSTSIPIGSMIFVIQKGSESGYSTLDQNLPYSL